MTHTAPTTARSATTLIKRALRPTGIEVTIRSHNSSSVCRCFSWVFSANTDVINALKAMPEATEVHVEVENGFVQVVF